jgi:hypothetical protein
MGNGASADISSLAPTSGLLFAQLPQELNLIILKLLDVETLLKISATCKRWLNNTKYLENLSLCLTNKPIVEDVPTENMYVKRRRTRLTKLNWKPIEVTLKRFDPERLRFLNLHPDLLQPCPIVNNFISRATNLTELVVSSDYQMDAIASLPPNIMKGLVCSSKFNSRCAHFPNLERLSICVVHLNYELMDLSALTQLSKLRCLSVQSVCSPYLDVQQIGQLIGLKELYLDCACLNDDQFKQLSTLTNLEILSLSNLRKELPADECTMDDSDFFVPQLCHPNPVSGLRHFTNLVKLTYLDISYVQKSCEARDDEQVQEQGYDVARLVSRHLTNLKEINISCTELGLGNRARLKEISGLNVVDRKDPLNLYGVESDSE